MSTETVAHVLNPTGPGPVHIGDRCECSAEHSHAPDTARVAACQGAMGSSEHLRREASGLDQALTLGYGIPPRRYLLGRRLDLARRRLLAGESPVEVAMATGFYDQAHLTRHFRRLLSTTPGRYQRNEA